MLTTDRIISFGWPGCGFDTEGGQITRWYDANPLPQPTPDEIEAKRADAEEYYRRAAMKVTPRQFRLAMLGAGLLDDAEAIVAGADKATQIAWEYAVSFERVSPLIDQVAAVMGKAPAEVDAIFEAAALIGD